jgi:hypothetical protein
VVLIKDKSSKLIGAVEGGPAASRQAMEVTLVACLVGALAALTVGAPTRPWQPSFISVLPALLSCSFCWLAGMYRLVLPVSSHLADNASLYREQYCFSVRVPRHGILAGVPFQYRKPKHRESLVKPSNKIALFGTFRK